MISSSERNQPTTQFSTLGTSLRLATALSQAPLVSGRAARGSAELAVEAREMQSANVRLERCKSFGDNSLHFAAIGFENASAFFYFFLAFAFVSLRCREGLVLRNSMQRRRLKHDTYIHIESYRYISMPLYIYIYGNIWIYMIYGYMICIYIYVYIYMYIYIYYGYIYMVLVVL